ncbi:OmpA family protein [Robbsia sp. KACC 23696]|uniref:OmpA family protein n=1 Tax=Robbsia sp. KACC 23696 TaxID=3149231 RepID=UPI00325A5432
MTKARNLCHLSVATLMFGVALALSACGDSVSTDSARVAEKASDARDAANAAASDAKGAAAAAVSDAKGAASSAAADVKAETAAVGAAVAESDPVGLNAIGDRGTAILDQTAKGVASLAEGGSALLGRLGVRLRDEDARGVARKSDGKTEGGTGAAKPGPAKAGVAASHVAKREADTAAVKSDAVKLAAAKTDAAVHDLAKGDVTQLDAAKREVTQADATVPADAIAREALAKHRAADVETTVRDGRIVSGNAPASAAAGQPVLATVAIPFAFNASTMAPAHAKALEPVVAELLRDPARHAILSGRADSHGAVGYNRTLARKRAEAVRKHLLGRGVVASQLTVRSEVGVAKDVALADDSDRRVDVIFR